MNTTILFPAYGKQYATVEEARAAWDKGVDFTIKANGSYCSIRDIAELQYMFSNVYIYLPNIGRTLRVSTH